MRFTAFIHSRFSDTSKSSWLGRREIKANSREELNAALEGLKREGFAVSSIVKRPEKAKGPTRQR